MMELRRKDLIRLLGRIEWANSRSSRRTRQRN